MEENTSNNTGTIVAGIEGGPHVVDGPLTTDIARKESTILVNEIDSRIVKVRPMATPIDQISRWAGTKQVGSQVVDYYSVDTKPTVATITEGHTEPSAADVTADAQLATLHTSARPSSSRTSPATSPTASPPPPIPSCSTSWPKPPTPPSPYRPSTARR